MRVFQTTYKDRRGVRRTTKRWYVEFRDHLRTVRRLPAFNEKRPSEALGRQLEALVSLRTAGEQPTAELRRWLEMLPASMRTKLAKMGLLDSRSVAASKPLREHLHDFKQALLDKRNTEEHVNKTEQRVRWVLDGIGAGFMTEVTAAAVSRYLAERRADGLSVASSNHYRTAAKGFFRWLVRERRITESPVAHLSKLNEKTDRRRVRRALELDEFVRLLKATHDEPKRFGMTGAGAGVTLPVHQRDRAASQRDSQPEPGEFSPGRHRAGSRRRCGLFEAAA